MSEHKASIRWALSDSRYTADDFKRGKYSREHTWSFDGGLTVSASSSPTVVPVPYSNPAFVDPEEALVASLSSCHMLTFLYVATKKGFIVATYDDDAVGVMSKNAEGLMWISRVELHPRVTYAGERTPTSEELDHLHHESHRQCFISNSVKTEIVVVPDLG